ncbi:hypothetical protein LTS08_006612 [Lithohypha guttulata]|uniref:Uncharacterized protein n=2 Tax=Lithohypha guttulata TaxID=1690604 RepID=A0AAN7PJJ8_9EURO|nr:hypothetical protein LTR51_000969 [Lithohypha guttulata]KAK5080314.1 hypothetical protein LTR05_008674 [Lithohypha guttulata]KAK5081432.1 hypothetical protein LTR24_008238 [Lithohypha guttulata]KAK5097857.1 hypothetical protein LTS08_006612 [Lithohypha guttulata]KAK5313820.1 hypothetical protein LTR70_007394 [Exophiala xenobiotica]
MPFKIGKPRKRRPRSGPPADRSKTKKRGTSDAVVAGGACVLFGAEVYLLVKDEHNAHYFASEEQWIGAPEDVGAVRVEAPGRKVHRVREDLSVVQTGSDDPEDISSEGSDSTTAASPLCATSKGRDLQSGYSGFVDCLKKVQRALGTLRRPDVDHDDADFEIDAALGPEGDTIRGP